MSDRRLSADAIRFRRRLIDEFWVDDCFGYVSEDHFVGECPLCGAALGVEFAGCAPRAALRCHGGCTEAELAESLGLVVRP